MQLSKLTTTELGQFLRWKKLDHCVEIFESNQIDGAKLCNVASAEDIVQFGIDEAEDTVKLLQLVTDYKGKDLPSNWNSEESVSPTAPQRRLVGVTSATQDRSIVYHNYYDAVSCDKDLAVHNLRVTAERGDHLAEGYFALAYFFGCKYFRPDKNKAVSYATKAVSWLKAEASSGCMYSQGCLGVLYKLGCGVERDLGESLRLLQQASDQGNRHATTNLAILHKDGLGTEHNMAEAVRLFNVAVELGDASAQCDLGFLYFSGLGVPHNAVEAVRLFKLAAEQGHRVCIHNLGVMYQTGEGVQRNPLEAIRYFKMSAAQGHASSQFRLGGCYETGDGVTKNLPEAARYYRMAAELGDRNAVHALSRLETGCCCFPPAVPRPAAGAAAEAGEKSGVSGAGNKKKGLHGDMQAPEEGLAMIERGGSTEAGGDNVGGEGTQI
jgi:TPR repeat protein